MSNLLLGVINAKAIAIYMALYWIQYIRPSKILIASDSSGALVSIKHYQSEARQDIIREIAHMLQRIKREGVEAKLIWVPAHIGFEDNDMAGRYAKSATRKEQLIDQCL